MDSALSAPDLSTGARRSATCASVLVAPRDWNPDETVYWFDESETPTVRRAVEHFRLIEEVDMTPPIILGPDGRVVDGMHRIARAILEGRTTIRAVRFAGSSSLGAASHLPDSWSE
jgi:hypothetical protein